MLATNGIKKMGLIDLIERKDLFYMYYVNATSKDEKE